MAGSKLGGSLCRTCVERRHADAHAGDRVTGVADAIRAGERDQRLAVGTRWKQQVGPFCVSRFDFVDGTRVVCVRIVEQRDDDARVEDQRCHSSRNRSSSPGS